VSNLDDLLLQQPYSISYVFHYPDLQRERSDPGSCAQEFFPGVSDSANSNFFSVLSTDVHSLVFSGISLVHLFLSFSLTKSDHALESGQQDVF
jgi:hypothetical protein